MRIKLIFIASLTFLTLSCARELEPVKPLPIEEGFEHNGKVTFFFTPQFADNQDCVGTKAFNTIPVDGGGNSSIKNIFFAVFDVNGYKLSEYAAAVPNRYATANSPSVYEYSVELTVTDQPRIIHIIANAPDRIAYGSETEVIGGLSKAFDEDSWDGDDAYWNRIYLEHGVWAQPDPSDAEMPGYQDKLNKFNEVRDLLSTAKLVRNFAKITVINSAKTNFEATRFWLTNVPDIGSVAPYNRNTSSFQIDYSEYHSVDELRGTGENQGNYQGFLPASANLCTISGKGSSWLDSHAIAIDPENGGSSFCYEREVPRTDPLYVIVAGKYDSDDDGQFNDEEESFYKIDLRDNENNYFPILRNFDYRINVNTVKSKGASSVEAALSAAPSGDISTSIGLQELTNISNGISQIVVSETSRVIVGTTSGTEDVAFSFKYIPKLSVDSNSDGYADVCNNILSDPSDIATARANHDSYVTLDYSYGITGEVFDHTGSNPWTISATDRDDEFRLITFHPVSASDIVKTEEITITGHVWNEDAHSGEGAWENMSRVITYRLREKLNMTLEVTPSKVPSLEGEEINLTIGIDAGLPSSVFTLDMIIETEKLSVTSNGDLMPVATGPTTIPGSTSKAVFAFTKAITWEEYSATPTVMIGENGYKYFTCHFKTNTDAISGNTDEFWISNPYFNQNHIGFTTYTAKTFSAITLSPTSEVHVGNNVSLGFTMSALPDGGTVLIGLKGYEPGAGAALTYVRSDPDGYEIYSYTAAATTVSGIILIPFMTGNCYVKLMADEFTSAEGPIVEADRPEGAVILWADENGSDGTAIDWIEPQNYKVYNNNLIVGQTAKLTVYFSKNDANITIGDLPTTKGGSITHNGKTLYAYTTTGVYTAPTTRGNVPLSIKNGSDVIGGYSVPVYGISRGTALNSTTHAQYNSNGTGWYIIVNKQYTNYHLRSNGTNIVGVQTVNNPDDYNSLFGFNSASTNVKVMVPSKGTTAYYGTGTTNGATITLSTTGDNYTFQYSNNSVRIKTRNNRYWRQTSANGSVTISGNSYYNLSVYPVSFSAP